MSYRDISEGLRTGERGMVLMGVSFKGAIRGACLEATVEQRFVNPGESHLEVVYSFPLPWGAVVLGVEATLGDRHLKGAVVARQEAETRYENAIADGDAAIMVERNHDGSCCMNLGNLAPGESCTIRLRYAQLLQFEQGGLRLLVPTVIAPRYGDPVLQGGLMPHQASEHSLTAEYPFQLEIAIHGPLARGAVSSPSHAVTTQFHPGWDSDRMNVTLARHGFLDRDFILVIGGIAHNSVAIKASDCVETDRVAVLASFCPRVSSKEHSPLAVKLLVDCSGSMTGDSIGAARRALQSIVGLLTNGDRFSLSRFGSTVEHRSRGLWNLTGVTRVAAQRWANNLEADLGGTEMERALKSTFELSSCDAGGDVLLVTDGEIAGIDSTVERARASGHRLFVVGIGSSPAEIHLRRLAEATGGACDFVAPGEAVEPAILRMFHRLRSPRLTGLSLRWPEGSTPLWQSPLPRSVFDGDTINIFALFETPVNGQVVLGGAGPDGVEVNIGTASVEGCAETSDVVSRLVASERVKVSESPQELAVAYQLLTDYTNFLMVHVRSLEDKAVDMPDLHKVRQMVPAGWGGMGSVLGAEQLESRDCMGMDEIYDRPALSRRVSLQEDTCFDKDLAFDWGHQLNESEHVPEPHPVTTPVTKPVTQRHSSPPRSSPGLTPLALQDRLLGMPRSQWPSTFDGLRAMGLGDPLVAWVEQAIGRGLANRWPEHKVVTAFLHVIAEWVFPGYEQLRQSGGGPDSWLGGWKVSLKGDAVRVDRKLAKRIREALKGIAALQWPEEAYGMTG